MRKRKKEQRGKRSGDRERLGGERGGGGADEEKEAAGETVGEPQTTDTKEMSRDAARSRASQREGTDETMAHDYRMEQAKIATMEVARQEAIDEGNE